MMKNQLLFVAISALVVTSAGVYLAKNSAPDAPSERQIFLADLSAVSGKTDSGKKLAKEAPSMEEAPSIGTETAGVSALAPASPQLAAAASQTLINPPPVLCPGNSPEILSHSIIINEVAWAGTASDKTSQEWIELKNISGEKISLAGWQIQNASQNIKVFFGTSDTIPAGGFYLLERGGVDFLSGAKADKFFTNAIKNNSEAVRLFDKNCKVIDEVIADSGAGKNWYFGTAGPDYRSAERAANLAWHTYTGAGVNGIFGSPRLENSSPPPNAVNAANQSQAPVYYTLQILKPGTGKGFVASDPAGISCSAFCSEDSEDFISGTAITLTAVADADSEFAGWSGDCSGSSACSVFLNGNKSVTAVFNQIGSSPADDLPPPPASDSPTARSNVNYILISQVQITGGAGQTTNDFVEIYNPTGGQFNLKGHRLVKRTQTGTSDTLIKSWTADAFIPAYGFYLWANSDYAAIPAAPDVTTTGSLADNNGIAIRFGPNDTGTIIDSVAWGSAQNAFVEGSAFSANPDANQSLLRKSWQSACVAASYDILIGNGCDTNSNASDFEITQSSQPRN